jgi:rhodanese-related sulfurtransferase
MRIMDYFRPVSTWSVEKVREFLESHDPGEYNLVDVRQAKEYEKEHLPGAKHIPVGEIADRVGEMDPARPTITYCAIGARSRAAASFLHRAGFHEVHSMEGGMAHRGLVGKPYSANSRSLKFTKFL